MKKFFTLFLLTFALVVVLASCQSSHNSISRYDIIVASKGFTEQDILSELLAQQIEAKTNLKVGRRRFTSALVTHQALVAGKIDAYVEYTGTALVGILKQKKLKIQKLSTKN